MIKRLALASFVLCSLVAVVAPSRAASDGADHRQPLACLKNGEACSGYGCCSHNCVQSKCVP